MRKIAIAAAVSLSLSGVTGISHALGLGEIEMYSGLNQALDAEIEILSATEDEIRDMQVQLASADAFARAGLEQLPALSSVVFAVDRRPDGKAVVKVTSDGPVVEPFLNFLIEVDAPGSVKLVREYTVLLNPATLADSGTSSTTTSFSDQTIGSGVADIGGVQIDLTDSVVAGGTATAAVVVADNFTGNDTGNEVVFTESSVGTFTVPVADTSAEDSIVEEPDNLFLPDDDVFANSDSGSTAGSTVIDSDGELISLEQELNLTPQFESGVVSSSGVTGDGEAVLLDNLGAQNETVAVDNSIFDSDVDGDLIAGDELRALVQPDVVDAGVADAGVAEVASEATVQFTETVVAAADSNTVASEIFATEIPASEEPADTDAAAGDLIDLSGVIDETTTFPAEVVEPEVVTTTTNTVATQTVPGQSVQTSGTYRIQSSDTLWSISNAQKARGTTPHQMMVALLDANPAAFVNGNMNRMRNGVVLQIPTVESQTLVEPATALAIVRSWTRDNRPPVRSSNSAASIINSVVVDNNVPEAEIVVSDLDSVNERYEQVRDELAEETLQRDELQGRVDNLADNVEAMKELITVRENDLAVLQNEVDSAQSNAVAIDTEISNLSNASNDVAELQNGLNRELADAQEEINRQADLDKNIADAEAQAQSVRLSSEESALRAELAALKIEKRELEASSQVEKAALARESEVEKMRLLAEAKSERERIMSELEAEKARIGIAAEAEIARIRGEAVVENQRVLNEAQAERERLKAETEQMQLKLAEVEAEKMALEDADAARISEEKLAMEKQAALEKAEMEKQAAMEKAEMEKQAAMEKAEMEKAEMEKLAAAADDTDAAGVIANATESGKSMLAGGTAAAGGLLGVAPLQEMIGNRKNVLAAGAGLSLLGLLGAWALRRRKHTDDTQGLRPRAETRPVVSQRSFEQEQAMYGDDKNDAGNPQVQQRSSSNSGAAAAAAAAAAVTGTAGMAAAKVRSPEPPPAAPEPVAPAPAAPPAPSMDKTKKSAEEEELEAVALDDTITEAEVYLRYGLHGQAEDLLKTAIERSPGNEEYHFKLLENYHDQKNPADFKKAASKFTEKFPASGHASRIDEMAAELEPSGAGGAGGIAAGVAGAGAVAAGALSNAGDAAAGGLDSAAGSAGDLLDQTIDPGTEFSVDELQATGNGAMTDEIEDFGDQGGMALDDVDIASLDDDGTMNLEEVAGSQMSGGDLGSMDLTNPVDGTFDNLTLDDAELNVPDSAGFEKDLPLDSPVAGGTDEMETMLDLAKAYIDMGDEQNAYKALKDIAARGNPLQQTEANELLKKLN